MSIVFSQLNFHEWLVVTVVLQLSICDIRSLHVSPPSRKFVCDVRL